MQSFFWSTPCLRNTIISNYDSKQKRFKMSHIKERQWDVFAILQVTRMNYRKEYFKLFTTYPAVEFYQINLIKSLHAVKTVDQAYISSPIFTSFAETSFIMICWAMLFLSPLCVKIRNDWRFVDLVFPPISNVFFRSHWEKFWEVSWENDFIFQISHAAWDLNFTDHK